MALAISPEKPPVFQTSSTITARLVFLTDSVIVSMSSGWSVLRSMTSASVPCRASISAAWLATWAIRE